MTIKVAINGYGTIGKRVADAVAKQDDMEVVGVTKTRPTWEAKNAIEKGFKLYCGLPDNKSKFEEAGIKIEGDINDLLDQCDIVVDCSPKGKGAENKEKYYDAKSVKVIYEGAEKHEVAGTSFNAYSNYSDAVGKKEVRVVSCNTTGLSRALNDINKEFGIKKARVVLVRRASDPGSSKSGPVDGIVPNPITVPSHHGPDVNTVLPDLNIITSAFKVSSTFMHAHSLMIELDKEATADQVKELFKKNPRIMLVKASDGLTSTAELMEFARDFGRPRYDMYENLVWEDSIGIQGNELFFFQAIPQESLVIPENIDCIRAMCSDVSKEESMEKTNQTLGIK
ncbi:MAG: type II glyceraldehyde-3-phosphate dehydrogenase [Candidatus Undinarchaeales archaeon]|jgi:glyceraldehyde-3-phosphate dehydrogenase (NAD(P))|nr:type II glyceraldehyde-3-phosphate dehydrogenase [Candidatus Undinarchaeales archaeon]